MQQVYSAWSGRAFKKRKDASIASHRAAWNKRIFRYAGRKVQDVTLHDTYEALNVLSHAVLYLIWS